MKIENKCKNSMTTFKDISYGEVFLYEGDACMKVEPFQCEDVNAVDLSNGAQLSFCDNEYVQKVNAVLTIE